MTWSLVLRRWVLAALLIAAAFLAWRGGPGTRSTRLAIAGIDAGSIDQLHFRGESLQ